MRRRRRLCPFEHALHEYTSTIMVGVVRKRVVEEGDEEEDEKD